MGTRPLTTPLWILAPLLAILACGGGGPGSNPPSLSSASSLPTDSAYQFEAKPYLQLGNNPTDPGQLTLAWHSLDEAAVWGVDVQGHAGAAWTTTAAPVSSLVTVAGSRIPPHRVWTAVLKPLDPGGEFAYRVLRNGKVVFSQAGARARKGPGQPQRIAVVADLLDGHGPGGLAVASQIHAQKPDLLVAVGDLVYDRGTVREYRDRFFPAYNGDQADPAKGAPIMRGTPMVGVLGNHDVNHVDRKKIPPLNGLAYFYYWDQPLDGPDLGLNVPNLHPPAAWADFRAGAGDRYPRMGNFSFRAGDVHWTILDSNLYMHWQDKALRDWLEQDLAAAKDVPWRFVAFHHPGFNLSTANHTGDWHMAQIWPLLQKHHVDLVFNGHLHTYQRTTPMTITPAPTGVTDAVHCANEANIVPDKVFDGVSHTRANGPIQILTGGGGGFTHSTPLPTTPKAFHGKVVLNKHCFSLLEVDAGKVVFRQLGTTGKVLDSFTLTR